MPANRSNGGATWSKPLLTVHGPKPSTSTRRVTTIVRSWCQGSPQFVEDVLSKRIVRTGRAASPRIEAATLQIAPVMQETIEAQESREA